MEEIDFESHKKALGARIAKLRRSKGLSLEKLAYEAGISKGNLSDIENGKKDPRYSSLLLIAGGLQIKLTNLLRNL